MSVEYPQGDTEVYPGSGIDVQLLSQGTAALGSICGMLFVELSRFCLFSLRIMGYADYVRILSSICSPGLPERIRIHPFMTPTP